jgi:hypothetical protein
MVVAVAIEGPGVEHDQPGNVFGIYQHVQFQARLSPWFARHRPSSKGRPWLRGISSR